MFRRVAVAMFLFVAVISQTFAQLPAGNQPSASHAQSSQSQAPPEDGLGRSTPYGTVTGFLSAAGHGNFARAAKYLDSQQSEQRKEELARQLKFVMDRGLQIDVDELDRTPEGRPDDMAQPDRETVGVARSKSEDLDIVLQRVHKGQAKVWLFSSVTLLSVPDFAAGLEAPWIEDHLPKGLVERRLAGIPLYRWIFVPLSVVVVFAAACIIVWLLRHIFWGSVRRFTKSVSEAKHPHLVGPLRLLVFTLLVHTLSRFAPTLVARNLFTRIAAWLTVVGFCWLLMRVVDTFAELMTQRMEHANAPPRSRLFVFSVQSSSL